MLRCCAYFDICTVLFSSLPLACSCLHCPLSLRSACASRTHVCIRTICYSSYTIHKVQKEQSPYNTGIAAALSFFDSLVPESIICWAGGAIFGALEFLSERSLSRDAYLKGESPHEWSKLGAGIAASSKSVDKPSTSASLRTAHQIPKDRPRAWGFGSLAVLDAPSLVP